MTSSRLLVVFLAGAMATGIWAQSLVEIEPYNGVAYQSRVFTGTNTEGRAITPDGQIVVGYCTGSDSAGPATIGFAWDATNGIRLVLSSDNALAEVATGVGYRTIGTGQQVVAMGLSAGYPTYWLSDDGGMTWLPKLRDTSLQASISVANTLGGTDTDLWWGGLWRTPDARAGYIDRGSGDPTGIVTRSPSKSTTEGQTIALRAASGTGRTVGHRKDDGGARRNWYLDWAGELNSPAQVYFDGLKGDGLNHGEAWCVTSDGTIIFGHSPTPTTSSNMPYVHYTLTSESLPLPLLPDATTGVPYGCSADGSYAVGMLYPGFERAVLWDLRDADPANWTVWDLTSYFAASGMMGNFSRLGRAYSVGVNSQGNVVVTGLGYATDPDLDPENPGALYTRAFVATLPPPPYPTSGACCQLGSCSTTFQTDCVASPSVFKPDQLCANAACPGACCIDDGTCSDFVTSEDCALTDGIFRGGSSICAEGVCEGACCLGFRTCELANYGACDGDFAGVGVSCEAADCPCSVSTRVWADADVDDSVDMSDFAALQRCLTLGYPEGGLDEANCFCFDRNEDGIIDDLDVEEFIKCGTGAGVAWEATVECPG